VNNSKKLRARKKEKNDRLIEKKPLTKPWIFTSVALLLVLISALLFDQLYQSPLISINSKKYTISDLSYYFYSVESTYAYYDQMLGGGGTYWDMPASETSDVTVREQAKTEAVNAAIQNEVLYKEAIKAGYALTAEDKTTVKDKVNSLLTSQMSAAVIKKNNFTKKYLTNVVGKATLVTRYTQDKIDALPIDDAAIKATIKYDDYRQYNIEYLFVSTKTTDDKDATVDMTADQKKAAYDKINGYYDTAKTTKDWSKLLPDTETDVTYKATNFVESGTTFSVDFEKMMVGMKNADISDIYEDETGYYIVRMIDNNSSESYDTAVKDAISTKENTEFQKVYEGIAATYKISTNKKAIGKLKMGTITLE